MKQTADSELIELIKQSNYPAFTEVYQRYWKYIYSIAYSKTADKDDAFDLTQNVFMELYARREGLIINIPLKNYLRTAILYKLSNYFRTRGFREKHYEDFKRFLAQVQASDTSFDTLSIKETAIEFADMVELIYQTIDEMPDKMKTIFVMSRTEQYSIHEIAEKLDISPQTVKNQISKAFARLRAVAAEHDLPAAQMLFVWWLTQA